MSSIADRPVFGAPLTDCEPIEACYADPHKMP
jgi:hypothetical protein